MITRTIDPNCENVYSMKILNLTNGITIGIQSVKPSREVEAIWKLDLMTGDASGPGIAETKHIGKETVKAEDEIELIYKDGQVKFYHNKEEMKPSGFDFSSSYTLHVFAEVQSTGDSLVLLNGRRIDNPRP